MNNSNNSLLINDDELFFLVRKSFGKAVFFFKKIKKIKYTFTFFFSVRSIDQLICSGSRAK